MKLRSTCVILLVFGLFFFSISQMEAQSRRISIQGTLKDASGAAVSDGEQELIFKLYHGSGSSEVKWEETATVPVVGGIYSHNLGSVVDFPEDIFGQTLYLGVTVGGRELTPRTELTYAPYAISVASTLKIATGGCSGQVGDVKYSILAPEDFAKENGDCWVPMDGRDIPGTKLAEYGISFLPDAGGLFLRAQEFRNGANNDPNRDWQSPIAQTQDQSLQSHNHGSGNLTANAAGNHNHNWRYPFSSSEGGNGRNSILGDDENFGAAQDWIINTSTSGNHTHTISGATSSTGAAETRPKNLNLWIYIRVN